MNNSAMNIVTRSVVMPHRGDKGLEKSLNLLKPASVV